MKLLLKLVVLAVILFGLLGVAGWFLVPPAAKGAVEKGSSYAFGVPASLSKIGAQLGLGTSGLALEGYSVASPEGFDGKPLLQVQKLGFGVGTRSLLGEPKVIDELVLEGFELNLVQKGTASNLLPVLQQVKRLAGGSASTPGEETGGAGSPGPRLKVRRVRIAGLAAGIEVSGIPGLGDVSKRFELPAYDADWSALTGEQGLTVAELSGKLLEQVTASALAKGDEVLPAAAMKVVRASLDGGLAGGLAGGLGGALDAARGELEDSAKKELDGLKEKGVEQLEELQEKGAKELDRAKEKVNELIGKEAGGALSGVVEGLVGDKPKASGEAVTPPAEGAQQKANETVEKAAETVEKAVDKATEKAAEGAKKLFGGKKPGG